ncbi:MAG: hypothetical protein HY735_23395, partial [Verrucomicrobia bacterium]|nr:hypothetical protein [Verrucomicrobiota bacterium]
MNSNHSLFGQTLGVLNYSGPLCRPARFSKTYPKRIFYGGDDSLEAGRNRGGPTAKRRNGRVQLCATTGWRRGQAGLPPDFSLWGARAEGRVSESAPPMSSTVAPPARPGLSGVGHCGGAQGFPSTLIANHKFHLHGGRCMDESNQTTQLFPDQIARSILGSICCRLLLTVLVCQGSFAPSSFAAPTAEFVARQLTPRSTSSALLSASVKTGTESNEASRPVSVSELGATVAAQDHGKGLSVTPVSGGAVLRCMFQRMEGQVTEDGLWLTSTTAENPRDRFRVIARAWGRAETGLEALNRKGQVQVEKSLARLVRPGLVEEYSVSVDGVRQDFVLARRPAGSGELRVELEVAGARAEATADGAALVAEGSGRRIAYNRIRVLDATGRTLSARIEMESDQRLAVVVRDIEAVYPVRIDPTYSDVNWSALGQGMNGPVYTLAVDGTGNLYAGGQFNAAGGVGANFVAKWNGSNWSALGSGMNYHVYALAMDGAGNVYAGGQFNGAGGV